MALPGWMSTEEAARALSVEPATLEKWARLGIVRPKVSTDDGSPMLWNLDDLRGQVRRIVDGQS